MAEDKTDATDDPATDAGGSPDNREPAYDEDSGTGIGGNVASGDAKSAEDLKEKNKDNPEV